MSSEAAIYTILAADGPTAALVGTRIYPVYAPQAAVQPMVVFTEVSSTRDYSTGGSTGLEVTRFQVTCWATSPDGAIALAAAVLTALDGYSGTAGSQVIQFMELISRYDIPSLSPADESQREFGKALDFYIHTCS